MLNVRDENDSRPRKMIQSYEDLDVYQNLYQTMLIVMRDIVPKLPKEEKFDLVDQMRRSSKAPPVLLAEGFAKRYQKNHWRRYIDDAIGECNEMRHHLDVCKDIYNQFVDRNLCLQTRESYIIASKQLYKLQSTWRTFHEKRQ